MAITEQDIKRLRREAERDLEALARVEAMLARRNGFAVAPNVRNDEGKERGQLKQLAIEVLRTAASDGLRPGEVLKAVRERGYSFKSADGAAASISTVLTRLANKDRKVEKKNGKYFWKEETGKD